MNKDEGNLYVVTFEYLGAGVNVHDSNTGTAPRCIVNTKDSEESASQCVLRSGRNISLNDWMRFKVRTLSLSLSLSLSSLSHTYKHRCGG